MGASQGARLADGILDPRKAVRYSSASIRLAVEGGIQVPGSVRFCVVWSLAILPGCVPCAGGRLAVRGWRSTGSVPQRRSFRIAWYCPMRSEGEAKDRFQGVKRVSGASSEMTVGHPEGGYEQCGSFAASCGRRWSGSATVRSTTYRHNRLFLLYFIGAILVVPQLVPRPVRHGEPVVAQGSTASPCGSRRGL